MKRILLFLAALVTLFGWTSCGHKDDYKAFVGKWGADRIDYYNIDYAGNPIESSRTTYYFTPGDPDYGFDLIFRDDRSGEMLDRTHDTLGLYVYDESNTIVDTIRVPCTDSTLVTTFTYSYHDDDELLYMNLDAVRCYYKRIQNDDETYTDQLNIIPNPYTYKMQIQLLTEECFIYENEYRPKYVEKARLIRISDEVRATKSPSKPVPVPYRPGSLFGNYGF